jgi:hypothetical protein
MYTISNKYGDSLIEEKTTSPAGPWCCSFSADYDKKPG